jgi:hypothetical protein
MNTAAERLPGTAIPPMLQVTEIAACVPAGSATAKSEKWMRRLLLLATKTAVLIEPSEVRGVGTTSALHCTGAGAARSGCRSEADKPASRKSMSTENANR